MPALNTGRGKGAAKPRFPSPQNGFFLGNSRDLKIREIRPEQAVVFNTN